MALYTILNREDFLSLLSNYGISSVLSFKELVGGSQNSNYKVITEKGEFVVSICEQNSKEEVHELALLLEHLQRHNFATSEVIRTLDGETLSAWESKPVMLKRFIHGSVLDDIPIPLATLVGKEMARLHQVPAPDFIQKSMSYGVEYFHEINEYARDSKFAQWLNNLTEFISPYLTETLPKALIHSDVFSSNVIVCNPDEVRIMDFEEATHYYRVFDIAMTFIGVCREEQSINFDKAKSLLDGYRSVINLTHEEISSLRAFTVYAAAAMSFWRHRNFHYTVPTPELFDHYLELKRISDTIKKMKEKEFLFLLGIEL